MYFFQLEYLKFEYNQYVTIDSGNSVLPRGEKPLPTIKVAEISEISGAYAAYDVCIAPWINMQTVQWVLWP